ncbi:MAG: hypothetical protein Q8P24_05640 [Desulfobacterales bacterium]|nr:hypothetical protein [Desulfobacterales bacterium]
MKTVTFDEALEIIESFPEEQKESIIEIVKRRLTDERRERLAQTVTEARDEYARGEVKRAYRKKVKNDAELKDSFWDTVEMFGKDPFHPRLRTHKLTGKLEGL